MKKEAALQKNKVPLSSREQGARVSWGEGCQIKKNKQMRFLVLSVIFLLVAVLVTRQIFSISRFLTTSFLGRGSFLTTTKISNNHLNLLINVNPKEGRNIIVASLALEKKNISPVEKKMFLVFLPDNLYVNVPQGYGDYQLSSVFALGQLEKKSEFSGADLLARTVSSFLAIPIDGYMEVETKEVNLKNKDAVLAVLKSDLGRGNLIKYVLSGNPNSFKSTFSPLSLWGFSEQINTIGRDQVGVYDLKDSNALKKETLADNTTVMKADLGQVDQFLSGTFFDDRVANERLKVEVWNGTEKEGFGSEIGRIVTNLGGNLVNVGNNDGSRMEKTLIFGGQSYTIQRLAKYLAIPIKEDLSLNPRSDITIALTEDIWKRMYSQTKTE